MGEPKPVSRRDFLKLGGLSLLGLAAKQFKLPESLPEQPVNSEKESRPKIDFDQNGVMSIDGEPIVPVVMYGLPGDHDLEESWEKASDLGVNVVTMILAKPAQLEKAKKFDIKVMVRIDTAFQWGNKPAYTASPVSLAKEAEGKEALFAWWDENHLATLKYYEIDPAVIAWEDNEPDPWKAGEKHAPEKYPEMKHLELFIEWMNSRSEHKLPLRISPWGGYAVDYPERRNEFLEGLYRAYDGNVIAGPNAYAEPSYIYKLLSQYQEYWENNAGDNKTHWGTISAHSNVSDPKGPGLLKEVSSINKEKLLEFFVAAIIGGSRALSFYDNPYNCNFAGFHPNLKDNGIINAYGRTYEPLMEALRVIEPVKPALLGESELIISGPIKYRKFTYDGRTYFFVCNISDIPGEMTLEGKKGDGFRNILVEGEENYKIKSNKLCAVRLKPGQTAIFVPESN